MLTRIADPAAACPWRVRYGRAARYCHPWGGLSFAVFGGLPGGGHDVSRAAVAGHRRRDPPARWPGAYLVRRTASRRPREPAVPCFWPGAASSGVGYDANVSNIRVVMEIDPLSPVPLHEQVAAALRRAIA